ncbi:MAG: YfhO family protein [Lachnospiraceae bacterium]|nr:YfhO family protein [Lachnospiraceae bacterium]
MKVINKKRSIVTNKPLILYTALFWVVALVLHCVFEFNGMSYVQKTDGYAQHLPVLAYIGNYIRDYIQQVISGKGIIPPMFDTSLLQGMDVVGTLHYYGLFEPLNWISAIVSTEYVEKLYGILLYVRLYFTGFNFIIYVMYLRKKVVVSSWVFMLGGLMYAFCGYCMFVGFRHPFFTTAAVMLPLILYGVEKCIQENKVSVFLWSIAVSCMMNFYFAYINTALMAFYVLGRLCCGKVISWKERMKSVMRLIGAYVLAVGISAFSFIPAVMVFLSNSRGAEAENDIRSLIVYPIEYYAKVLYCYITPSGAIGYWTCLGFAVIVVPCVVLMWCRVIHKEKREQQIVQVFIGFIVSTIMVLLPVFGKVLNGFAYISNRWTYGYALMVGLVVVYMFPEVISASKKEKICMVSGCLASAIYISIIQYYLNHTFNMLDYIATMMIIVITAVLIYLVNSNITKKGSIIRGMIVVTILLNLIMNIYFVFAPEYGGYVKEFLKNGTAVAYIENLGTSSCEEIEEESFYRVDGHCNIANSALMFDYNSTGGYYSVISEDFLSYYQDLGISGLDRASVLQGFDRNQILNSLSNTKYIQTKQKREGKHLYGYRYVTSSVNQKGKKYHLYENENYIPFGYVYNQSVDTEKFYQYSKLERQLLLTEAVVLDEAPENLQVDDSALTLVNKKVYSNVSIDGGKATVADEIKKELHIKKKKNSTILKFNSEPESLVFLVINGLKGMENEQYNYNRSFAHVKVDKVKHKFFIGSPEDVAYIEKDSVVVPLGYFEDALTKCSLHFVRKGIYSYESIKIVSVPIDVYTEKISNLKTCALQNAEISNNTISGNVSMKTQGVMLFSVPYSNGWKAYVDGKEVQIQKANLTYMGLVLEEGEHEIKLKYCTPGMVPGIIISIFSFMISMFWTVRKGKHSVECEGER